MYQQPVSRVTPGCVVFLLDRSDSMRQPWADSGLTLAQGVARAVNTLLLELCIKSTKEQGSPMRCYYYVGIYGYGLRPRAGGEGVESALPVALAGRAIVPLPELAEQPVAVREETATDTMAPPSRVPVWVEPEAGYRTPMCEAMALAGAHVYEWATAFPDSFPPVLVNITDGLATDSPYQGADLIEWARRLSTISTRDGQALVLNAFVSAHGTGRATFPSSAAGLPEPGPTLFTISSELPEPMLRSARAAGVAVDPHARGLVVDADPRTLGMFVRLCTPAEVLHG